MGVKKGYRIQLGPPLKQLYPEDWMITPMMSWSLYQMAVTKYKENETQSITKIHLLIHRLVSFNLFDRFLYYFFQQLLKEGAERLDKDFFNSVFCICGWCIFLTDSLSNIWSY